MQKFYLCATLILTQFKQGKGISLLMQIQYPAVIQYDETSQDYRLFFPDLIFCSAHGKTIEEVITNGKKELINSYSCNRYNAINTQPSSLNVISTSYSKDIVQNIAVEIESRQNKKKCLYKTYSYPAVFTTDPDNNKYINVIFPDLKGYETYGKGLLDAEYMAKDLLATIVEIFGDINFEASNIDIIKAKYPHAVIKQIAITKVNWQKD